MATDPEIFRIMEKLIDGATSAFVSEKAASLITTITPWATAGVGLFITCYGYMVMTGRIQEPFMDGLLKCLKILLIAYFSLNTHVYLGDVVGTINGMQASLADALGNGNGGIFASLDATLGRGFDLTIDCFEHANNASWYEIGIVLYWYFVGLIILISTVIVTLIGGIIILVSIVALKLMFAVGPLFIMCLMFPVTTKFFDSWFSQTMSYTIKIVLIALVMAFTNEIFSRIITPINLNNDEASSGLVIAGEIIIAALVLYALLKETSNIAAQLSGGVSSAALTMGQLARGITSPLGKARNIIDPVTTRRDIQSGMMTTARRANHLVAGNTLVNPAYRQHVMSNIGKNWGKATGGKTTQG